MTANPWRYWDRRKVYFSDPVVETGDRERDTLLVALAAIEAREGERRGWDQEARMYSLHLADMDSCMIEVRAVPHRLWAGGYANPADCLAAFGNRLPQPSKTRRLQFADSPDGFCGAVFMFEGWGVPPDRLTEEDQARSARGERFFETRPDRIEFRSVVAADLNGVMYQVTRERGKEPETMFDVDLRGRVPVALARIAAGWHAATTRN